MNWTKEIIGLVIVVAVIAGLYSFGAECYSNGQTEERAAWQRRENTALVAANTHIVELEATARRTERLVGDALSTAAQTYQESLHHEKTVHERTVADLRAGHRRLRIELASRPPAAGDPAGPIAATAAGCDAATHGELSTAAAEFLVGLANEADTVVHQLTACQAVVIADRQINQPQGEP